MSTTALKKARKAYKLAQDYDPNPPRCSTCIMYQPQQYGGFSPTCTLGKFAVYSYALCNKWTDKYGNTIDRPE